MNRFSPALEEMLSKDSFTEVFDKVSREQEILLAKVQIQNLPWINAQFGPAVGDKVISAVASSLLRSKRRFALGQISKSLYAIISLASADQNGFLESLEDSINELNHSGAFPFIIEAAIGLVKVRSDSEKNMQYWADMANVALVASGRSGHGVVYTEKLTSEFMVRDVLARLSQESQRPEGIHWVYQAVNRSADKRIVGFEALIRWSFPGDGEISPDFFIPIAEELGVIQYFDRWTLQEVANNKGKLLLDDDVEIAINVSAKTIEFDSYFMKLLEQTVGDAKNSRSWLIIELTETALVENRETLAAKLLAIQELGVQIAIDDFGSGETNLAQVGQTPCDFLKIDKSLIQMKDRAQAVSLLGIAMSMAKLLGAKALIEGVETQEDFDLAVELGIPLMQGWFFGMPSSIDKILTT